MKIALCNPAWSFDGSIYFGCREPHLPLELGYARALLEAGGHEAELVDGQLEGLRTEELRRRLEAFGADAVVVPTAPSYLFWRCPPPELRVPRETIDALRDVVGRVIVVGPHGSTTPTTTLQKLDADVVVLGECEEVIAALARTPPERWPTVPGTAMRDGDGRVRVNAGPQSADMDALPALRWPAATLARHEHHHHRFDPKPADTVTVAGAEMETSRGCPYRCSFCAKETHRDRYRRRPLETVMRELDGLVAGGVGYVYVIDEIFLPDERLLRAIGERGIHFGVQTRIDLWSFEMLDLLGAAGCRSVEAGVESITPEGRAALDKRCKLSTEALTERLLRAKASIPFVQATLMDSQADDPEAVTAWRERLLAEGVWANAPVPLFPYPGSPDYTRLWGSPDEQAWERAHAHYLEKFDSFSDIQEQRPVRLPVLESGLLRRCGGCGV